MRTNRIGLCWACTLSLVLLTASGARAENDPVASVPRADAQLRSAVGGVISGVRNFIDNGVVQIKGSLGFSKWVKENETVRRVYAAEKDARGVATYDRNAALGAIGTGGGALVMAMSGNLPAAPLTVLAAGVSLRSLGYGSMARDAARFATVSKMLKDPQVKVPACVLKAHKLNLEREIGWSEKNVARNQQQAETFQTAAETGKQTLDRFRAELDQVNHSLPSAP